MSSNAVLEWQREANSLVQVYAKQIPIPFTEAGFRPGDRDAVVSLGGVPVGLGICWENVFSGLSRGTAMQGAQVMAYMNSLLWAGRTATPVLHLHISAFRALETGRDVIHATAGGPSAIISANGSIQTSSAQATETTVIGTVQPRTGQTPYLLLGDWVGAICSGLTGLALLLVLFKSRVSRARQGAEA